MQTVLRTAASQRTRCSFAGVALTTALLGQQRADVEFEPRGHGSVAAERWTIEVPEVRGEPETRTLRIRFLRFPAKTEAGRAATPVVYLAGGPGGSGIDAARGRRWSMFARLCEDRDVIALDQRGTGTSDGPEPFRSDVVRPADEPGTRELWTRLHRDAVAQAATAIREAGYDLRGYTTLESAHDLDAVREALGIERLHVLGISYGTHLALCYAKRFEQRVDRLVLASPEALDETVKLPAHTDAYFARLQQAIDAVPAARQRFPDVAGRIRAALERVALDRPRIKRWDKDGTYSQTLGPFDLQIAIGYSISDPSRATGMLAGVDRAAAGDFGWFERWLARISPRTVRVRGMPEAMDIASGISVERLAAVAEQRRDSLLGDALNFPMPHLGGAIADLDLGPDFRSPAATDRPTLILSGTLDGRTYPEAHAVLASRLGGATLVTIENAGHNLFFSHAEVVPMIAAFLAGEAPASRSLAAPLPTFGTK